MIFSLEHVKQFKQLKCRNTILHAKKKNLRRLGYDDYIYLFLKFGNQTVSKFGT